MEGIRRLKSFFWYWRGVFIATPLVSAVVILCRYVGLFQPLELFAYDLLLKWRPPETRDERIVIVGIGEEDVDRIGTALISDKIYAELLKKLLKRQPVAIGLDIYRDVPIPPGTTELNQVFAENDNIIGIEKMIGDTRQYRVKPPPILKAKNQVGFNDMVLDPDNKVRRALIALPDRKAFSLGMYLALLYLEKQGVTLTVTPKNHYWQLGNAVFKPLESNDGGYSGADSGGYQIMLNWRGDVRHFETVSLFDVLDNRLPPDWGKDKIILIGFVGESFQDVLLTPYTNSPDKRMPGVEVHANIISQVISTALDGRPLIKSWTETRENLWIVFWTSIGSIITWSQRKSSKFQRGIIIFLGVEVVLVAIVYQAFLLSWWLPLIPPLAGLILTASGITLYTARNAAKIRSTFGRYLSNEIVNTLLETPGGVKLGGERRTITILTSDLRGFTAISEQVPPEEVVKILNFYLGHMANVITSYNGTIDEFMGDGILVLFGAPVSRKDDADRAVACAIAMQLAMDDVNKQVTAWGYPPLKMGIGINTGEVVVGNIGSEKRTKYGVVGSEVNLTYRIESYSRGGEILISEKTLNSLKSKVSIAETRQVSPKGVKQPITIYNITGIEGKYNLQLPKIEEKTIPLSRTIAVTYSLLNEKDVATQTYKGEILQLIVRDIERGAIVKADFLPHPLDNLKFTLCHYQREDIYGKVTAVAEGENTFKVYFTYLSTTVEKILYNPVTEAC